MDPQTTWSALLHAWSVGDWEQVEDLAEALLTWFERNGFPPKLHRQVALGAEFNLVVTKAAAEFALKHDDTTCKSILLYLAGNAIQPAVKRRNETDRLCSRGRAERWWRLLSLGCLSRPHPGCQHTQVRLTPNYLICVQLAASTESSDSSDSLIIP